MTAGVITIVFFTLFLITGVVSFLVFRHTVDVSLPPMRGKLDNSDEKLADAMKHFELTNTGEVS